jgi:hypothetical protein
VSRRSVRRSSVSPFRNAYHLGGLNWVVAMGMVRLVLLGLILWRVW